MSFAVMLNFGASFLQNKRNLSGTYIPFKIKILGKYGWYFIFFNKTKYNPFLCKP